MTVHHQTKQLKGGKEVREVLDKIIVNAGVGRLSQLPNFEEKILPDIIKEFSLICGQRPQICKARKSISSFKLRQGQIIGLKATLRRQKMIDFFNRLITIVLPRIRDFNGVDVESIDKGGVLNIGLKEQYVFPEINSEESPMVFSIGINLVPRSRKKEAAIEAYRRLGVPFKK